MPGPAWSGRGRVTRVDVTLDGGRNWREARIDGPVLEKSLTRFYVDFDWQGEELPLIQSRSRYHRLPAADQGRIEKDSRRQLDLSQQRDPDLAGARQWADRECRDRLSTCSPRRLS